MNTPPTEQAPREEDMKKAPRVEVTAEVPRVQTTTDKNMPNLIPVNDSDDKSTDNEEMKKTMISTNQYQSTIREQ